MQMIQICRLPSETNLLHVFKPIRINGCHLISSSVACYQCHSWSFF
jgi:hypothetical protein